MSVPEYVTILLLIAVAAYMLSLPTPHERQEAAKQRGDSPPPQNLWVRCWQAACKALKLRRD